jgi:hypothetical protein
MYLEKGTCQKRYLNSPPTSPPIGWTHMREEISKGGVHSDYETFELDGGLLMEFDAGLKIFITDADGCGSAKESGVTTGGNQIPKTRLPPVLSSRTISTIQHDTQGIEKSLEKMEFGKSPKKNLPLACKKASIRPNDDSNLHLVSQNTPENISKTEFYPN